MTGSTRTVLMALSLGLTIAVVPTGAQSAATSTQIRQTAYLKASNAEKDDHFGCGGVLDGHAGYGAAVSGDGNTLVVAAPHESSAATGINGNQNDNSVYDSGAVYVFVRNGAGWAQQAYVKPSNTHDGDEFGHAVALSADGNTLAVSAVWESSKATGVNGDQSDHSVPQSGAVYVFTRADGRWTQQAYIKASNTGEAGTENSFGDGDQFGFSLALSDDGNTLAAGAITEDSAAAGINGNQRDNSMNSSGAVYIFGRTGATWAQQAYVKAANPDPGDMFGYSVALNGDGNTLAVGSYDEGGSSRGINGPADNQRRGSGAVYVFERFGTSTWSQHDYVKPSNAEGGDSFGVSVALSDDGNTLLVGSLDEDCLSTGVNPPGCDTDRESDTSTGAAYVFARTQGVWSQQAFLKAANVVKGDWFGNRLALSGDGNTALIGDTLEDLGGQGINPRANGKAAQESGSAYVFRRNATTWTQFAYLKGSNTRAFDEFGSALGISRDGRTMVVTARGEDSAAKGINGNQTDGSASEAGSAYIFQIGAPTAPRITTSF
jgi:hypothetical protein